jgi:hypothetical protein
MITLEQALILAEKMVEAAIEEKRKAEYKLWEAEARVKSFKSTIDTIKAQIEAEKKPKSK